MEIEYINEAVNSSGGEDINKGEIEFFFTASLAPSTVQVFRVLDGLKLGNKTFQRVGSEIYYEYIKYTVQLFHGLSKANKSEDELMIYGETKVALVWFRNPDTLNNADKLFGTVNLEGVTITGFPKAPVNPSFRKAFVVIRNKYAPDNICNDYYKQSTEPVVAIQTPHRRINCFKEYQPFRTKSKEQLDTERERRDFARNNNNNSSSIEQFKVEKYTKNKKSKLSYYSNSNTNVPLCTTYKIDGTDNVEIVTGELCFVIITGSNKQIQTEIMIEGRLCYTDSSH